MFIGRDAEMAAALSAAAERPGLLVVVGARWVGTTRFAEELAARLEADGATIVRPRGEGALAERLSSGLAAADLRDDPVTAAKLRPFAAVIDDVDEIASDASELGRALARTAGLLIGCMTEVPTDSAFIELEPLTDHTSAALIEQIIPDADGPTLNRLTVLGRGRPGVLVGLGRANRRLADPIVPLKIPTPILQRVESAADGLDPQLRELALWAAVLGNEFDPSYLAQLSGRRGEGLTRALDELIAAGVIQQVPEPGPMRMRFADPIVWEVLRQTLGPSELRRRHRAALIVRRSRGESATELVHDAVGSSDPGEVVKLSLRAAVTCRERGDGGQALVHAERAMAWAARRSEEEEVEARFEYGMALGTLGRWDDAGTELRRVIRQQRRAGREGAAVRAITAWTRIHWLAGNHAEALQIFEQNVPDGTEPLAERASALIQAAMFASHEGRHAAALQWATRARAEALACDDKIAAIRALDTMGLSRVFSSASPDGLTYFRTAFQEARAIGSIRQMAVSLNNESVSLLMLGMVRHAADRAQEALSLVAEHSIGEIGAFLEQNLAEAWLAMGRLPEARSAALRARTGYEAMGAQDLGGPDAVLASIDFATGKINEALTALRKITAATGDGSPLEVSGPATAMYAQAAQAAGESDEARAAIVAGLERRQGTEDRLDTMTLLGAACQILPAADAKPLIAELSLAAKAGSPLAAALVPYGKGWTTRSPAAAATAFRDAAAKFADADWLWWSARSLMLAGEIDPAGATSVEDLQEARRLFREVSSPGWRARCEALLRERGQRFVMPSRHRDQSELTSREIEVLELVAQGTTNREIAARLYVSQKTVGRHLEHIFGKLQARNRTTAVNTAIERGLIVEVDDPKDAGTAGSDLSHDATIANALPL
jgi:DNA-binding CsgD family transcriptional regulator/tetratricopeptide (TPR) repeat protein